MKAAFSILGERISPVFDVTSSICIVHTDAEGVSYRKEIRLFDVPFTQKALFLAELGVETLVCGAISKPLQKMITAYGIRVAAFVAGDLNTLIETWMAEDLDAKINTMPGCRKFSCCSTCGKKYKEG